MLTCLAVHLKLQKKSPPHISCLWDPSSDVFPFWQSSSSPGLSGPPQNPPLSPPPPRTALLNPFCFRAEGSWERGISGAMCAWLSLSLGPAALSCTSAWLEDLLDPSGQRFYPMQQPQLSPRGCLQQTGLRSSTWECSNTLHILFQAPPQHRP